MIIEVEDQFDKVAKVFSEGCNRRRALPRIAQATHING
jgi:hypothetical protein